MVKIGTDINEAKSLLERNELVAIPTETVYGLAANGLRSEAVAKIFEAKNRPSFNPLILHVAYPGMIKELVKFVPEKARQLAEIFWPGPMTLILPKKAIVPDIVTAGLDSVGVRVPDHPLTLHLLRQLNFPLAAPSANPFGYVSPTTPEHVAKQLGDKVSYILDGGQCRVGIESTIIKVTDDAVKVLRLGGIALEEIEEITGKVEVDAKPTENPEAPGMLSSHYAPGKKIILGNIKENLAKYQGKKTGVLSFTQKPEGADEENLFILSASGDLMEAASHLFDFLRRLDQSDVEIILAELLPEEGLGRAINDRLRRAAH